MQISDQGADAVRRLLLRLADLVELHADVFGLALLEKLARDVDLDRQPEEHLREIVVEVAGDLETFIGAFFRHRVREGTQHLLALLEFLVGFLERLRSEEHLPRQEERRKKGRKRPQADVRTNSELRHR